MRVQVNLSDEMVEKVDAYAAKMGVNRSALCAVLVGQGIMGYDKTFEIADHLGLKLTEEVKQTASGKARAVR